MIRSTPTHKRSGNDMFCRLDNHAFCTSPPDMQMASDPSSRTRRSYSSALQQWRKLRLTITGSRPITGEAMNGRSNPADNLVIFLCRRIYRTQSIKFYKCKLTLHLNENHARTHETLWNRNCAVGNFLYSSFRQNSCSLSNDDTKEVEARVEDDVEQSAYPY